MFSIGQGQPTLQSMVDQILNSETTIYHTNIDLVNDDVYTKFGLILSIRSQVIE